MGLIKLCCVWPLSLLSFLDFRFIVISHNRAVKSGLHHGLLIGMAADSDGEPHTGFTTISPFSAYKLGMFVKFPSKRTAFIYFQFLGPIGGRKVRQLPGACEEDNDLIQTVFTCHGNLDDPDFPQRFSHLLDQLSKILTTGNRINFEFANK